MKQPERTIDQVAYLERSNARLKMQRDAAEDQIDKLSVVLDEVMAEKAQLESQLNNSPSAENKE